MCVQSLAPNAFRQKVREHNLTEMHSDNLVDLLKSEDGKEWVFWEDIEENYNKKYNRNTKQNTRNKKRT